LKSGNYNLYFRTEKYLGTVNSAAQYLNQNIGYKIFTCGYENLLEYRKQRETFYKPQNSSKSAEAMLLAKDRDDAENRFSSSQYMPAKILLKNDDDYVVENNLEIKATAPENHPLKLVQKEVDKLLAKARKTYSSTFNLGQILQPLTDVPFGLYSNIPNVALLAFAMRKYQNELYEATVGTPLTADNLRDKVVEFFKNGNSGKLTVRFGSKEEKELKDKLVDIFDLTKIQGVSTDSIKQVRWGVQEYCTEKAKYPLWSLKYFGNQSDEIKQLLDKLVELIHKDESQPEQIKHLLNTIKQKEVDIRLLLATSNAFEEGFTNFVNQTEDVKIEMSWWKELADYFSERMQPEIGFWKEEDVKDKVKSFYIQKIKPKEDVQNPQTPLAQPKIVGTLNPNGAIIQTPPSDVKIKTVEAKIKSANLPSPALKYILLQILEKYPITADVINESL